MWLQNVEKRLIYKWTCHCSSLLSFCATWWWFHECVSHVTVVRFNISTIIVIYFLEFLVTKWLVFLCQKSVMMTLHKILIMKMRERERRNIWEEARRCHDNVINTNGLQQQRGCVLTHRWVFETLLNRHVYSCSRWKTTLKSYNSLYILICGAVRERWPIFCRNDELAGVSSKGVHSHQARSQFCEWAYWMPAWPAGNICHKPNLILFRCLL